MEPASFITVVSFTIAASVVYAIVSTIFNKKDPK